MLVWSRRLRAGADDYPPDTTKPENTMHLTPMPSIMHNPGSGSESWEISRPRIGLLLLIFSFPSSPLLGKNHASRILQWLGA